MVATVPRLRSAIAGLSPNVRLEQGLWAAGHKVVVGMDEVGRGSWAGPLTVGAAVIPAGSRVYKVRDSKLLTEPEREAIFDRIAGWVRAWAVGHASAEECDELGMSEAQRLAARRALEGLGLRPDRVVVDGRWDFVGGAIRVVGGDRTCLSVAAASVLAKVVRDRIMRSLALHYPFYNFEANKGYPCPEHKAALQAWGPSAIHRRSWVFMDGLIWGGLPRVIRPEAQLSFELEPA